MKILVSELIAAFLTVVSLIPLLLLAYIGAPSWVLAALPGVVFVGSWIGLYFVIPDGNPYDW